MIDALKANWYIIFRNLNLRKSIFADVTAFILFCLFVPILPTLYIIYSLERSLREDNTSLSCVDEWFLSICLLVLVLGIINLSNIAIVGTVYSHFHHYEDEIGFVHHDNKSYYVQTKTHHWPEACSVKYKVTFIEHQTEKLKPIKSHVGDYVCPIYNLKGKTPKYDPRCFQMLFENEYETQDKLPDFIIKKAPKKLKSLLEDPQPYCDNISFF